MSAAECAAVSSTQGDCGPAAFNKLKIQDKLLLLSSVQRRLSLTTSITWFPSQLMSTDKQTSNQLLPCEHVQNKDLRRTVNQSAA